MRALQWCMLGVSSSLLVAQITISQLCSSFISLVDSYHTLFLLMHMALSHTQSADKSRQSSGTDEKPQPPQKDLGPCPGRGVGCGLSYRRSRAQAMGSLVASLSLACLCVPSLMELCGFPLSPSPVQRPLLLVAVGAAALLHNALLLGLGLALGAGPDLGLGLGLGLGGAKGQGGGAKDAPDTQCYMEVNHKALAQEETKGSQLLRSDASDTTLVLCNPAAPTIPKGHPSAAVSLTLCKSPPPAEVCRRSSWLQTLVCVSQTLLSSALVLVSGLVMLANDPLCPDRSHGYGALVFLDPCLAAVAAVMLLAKATPEVRRYGRMLLQGVPPHISVPDLKLRMASVPGVDSVHEFHIWELTSSVVVASVHVRCQAKLTAQRFADVMSGVNKVLQGAGVSCCTIQPEFAVCSGTACKEDPSLPPASPAACSLACRKACADSMCCSPQEDQHASLLPKSPEETLVIENNFK